MLTSDSKSRLTKSNRLSAIRDMFDCLRDFIFGSRTRRAKRAELYAQFELGTNKGERDALYKLYHGGQWHPQIDTDPTMPRTQSTDNLPLLPPGKFMQRVHHVQQQSGTAHLPQEVYQQLLRVPAGETQSAIPAAPQQPSTWITSHATQQQPIILSQPPIKEPPTWLQRLQELHEKQHPHISVVARRTQPLRRMSVRQEMMQMADEAMRAHGSGG